MADTLERVEAPEGQESTSGQLMELGDKGLELKNLNDAWRFASMTARSELCPKDFKGKPESVLIAMQMGYELGLQPMQALQNIAVINGRPTLWGDAMLAIVEDSGLLEDFWEDLEGQGEQMVAVCYSKRPNRSKGRTTRFSVQDAKTAGLWGKSGPWQSYPTRMLQMRARGWNLRDNYPDVLKGMYTREEAIDMPASVTIDVDSKTANGEEAAASRADRLAKKLAGATKTAEELEELTQQSEREHERAKAGLDPFKEDAEAAADVAEEELERMVDETAHVGHIRRAQYDKIAGVLTEEDVPTEHARAFLSWMVEREIGTLKDLTYDEAESIIAELADGRTRTGMSRDKLAVKLEEWNTARAMAEGDGPGLFPEDQGSA